MSFSLSLRCCGCCCFFSSSFFLFVPFIRDCLKCSLCSRYICVAIRLFARDVRFVLLNRILRLFVCFAFRYCFLTFFPAASSSSSFSASFVRFSYSFDSFIHYVYFPLFYFDIFHLFFHLQFCYCRRLLLRFFFLCCFRLFVTRSFALLPFPHNNNNNNFFFSHFYLLSSKYAVCIVFFLVSLLFCFVLLCICFSPLPFHEIKNCEHKETLHNETTTARAWLHKTPDQFFSSALL